MAVAYLQGVLENGTQPRPRTLPVNDRQTLEVTQGATTQVMVRVTDAAGVPVTDGSITLLVGRSPGDQLFSLTGVWTPSLGPGVAVFSFLPGTTTLLQWGRYIYDVRLQRSGAVDYVVPASPFILQPAV